MSELQYLLQSFFEPMIGLLPFIAALVFLFALIVNAGGKKTLSLPVYTPRFPEISLTEDVVDFCDYCGKELELVANVFGEEVCNYCGAKPE